MTFQPCFVVPVYDPGPALARTVAALAPLGLPLYLTDDGSGEATRRELQALAAAEPLVRLTRLAGNQGKGTAVMEGLRRAHGDGFTHALQVDADGQHDLNAVGPFLALAQAHPAAVVAGFPRYDGTVPPAREYWRRVSHFFTWVNTLSLDIQDSLCGFRVYPLAATLRLLDRKALPARMAFDTEIIVRLHWAGVPVLNAPVNVTYPADGISHFRPWLDTFGLIWMHARLLGGMLRRLPRLLKRRDAVSLPWYRTREPGTALAFRLLLALHRLLGPRVVRVLAEGATCYFLLTARRARRASRDYLARVHARHGPLPGLERQPGLPEVYRHFRAFTRSTLDKLLAWSGGLREGDVDFPDREAFEALRRSGRGGIFLSAHLGNMDMLRALGVGQGLPGLNALVYSENAVRFHEILRDLNPDFALNLIQVSQVSPDMAVALQEKVDRGEFLFIVADRVPPSENGRIVEIPFLGDPAAFPTGPFLLAHLLGCPVHLMFCCREGQRYRIHLEPFAERLDWTRSRREAAIAQWAERYAQALETRCRETPFEWFNFFDFWRTQRPSP